MTSLREEIGDSIIKYRKDDNYMCYTCVNEILKLFEKKINEKIQSLQDEINSVERTQKPNTFFLSYEKMFIAKSLRYFHELKQELKEEDRNTDTEEANNNDDDL